MMYVCIYVFMYLCMYDMILFKSEWNMKMNDYQFEMIEYVNKINE